MKAKGFTLVELLAVIAIITILAALIFVVTGKVIVASQRATCASNMRQIGVAILTYAGENKGKLPYSFGGSIGPQRVDGLLPIADCGRVAQFLAPYVDDSVWDCTDPLNREARRMPANRGIVYTKYSDALTVDYANQVPKHLMDYDPAKTALFYCAYSPANGPGTPGNRPWPHASKVNRLYLDAHVGTWAVTWPD